MMPRPKTWDNAPGFGLLLLAVAGAAAAQTAALAFLPGMVDAQLATEGPSSHAVHVSSLSAAYPLGALVLAPFWGWLADRHDYRLILRIAVSVLALAVIPMGTTSLPALYGLRLVSGIASGAIIPIAMLGGAHCGDDMLQQSRRLTWLTAFMFLGDLVGPLFAEWSSKASPSLPFAGIGVAIAAITILLWSSRLPSPCPKAQKAVLANRPPRLTTSYLLGITIVGGGALSALHVVLLVANLPFAHDRATIAGMLSLCGFGMLAAQLFYTRVTWLVAAPRAFAMLAATALGTMLLLFPFAANWPSLAALIAVAGWSAASLRLLASCWISGSVTPSGTRLGLQHSATAFGQAAAPLLVAGLSPSHPFDVLWIFGLGAVALACATPLVLPAGSSKNAGLR